MFHCNLSPVLLAERQKDMSNNILHATAVTWGWNGYQNKSQHRKLTLQKKIILLLLCDKALWWCQLSWWTWCTLEAPQWCFNACRPWRTMRANNWLTVSAAVSFFALQLVKTTLTKTSLQSTEENNQTFGFTQLKRMILHFFHCTDTLLHCQLMPQ